MKVDVMIAHAAWSEPRKAPMRRLAESFGPDVHPLILGSGVRQHASTWALHLWREVQRSQADVVLCLNDDVTCHPDILAHCANIAALLPDDIISLHGNFPGFKDTAENGHKLARCYWPSGPGYLMRPTHARELLQWLTTIPPQWFAASSNVNEDGALASWLWSKQRPAYVTIPSLVRHDTTVPSTLAGYDDHPNRTTQIDWADFPVEREWQMGDVEIAPYVPVPWITDAEMRALGDSLRGVMPLCGLCHEFAASIVNERRNTGVCMGCSKHIARVPVQAALATIGWRLK
jgi:hypothetical protein